MTAQLTNNDNSIELKEITKVYMMGSTPIKAVDGINLKVKRSEYISIMGPSGSGKSTLLNIMGCLDTTTTGLYRLDGLEVSSLNDNQLSQIRNSKIGFVFQSYNLLPRLSAIKNVELPLLYQKNISATNRHHRALETLKIVGLENRIHHRPNELSGGESQRVAIARALITNPVLILADEPTGNLDTKSGDEIISLFDRLNQELKVTIIMVTHNPSIAEHTHRVIQLKDGKIISY
ncbi:MAG: ABC transporter ATP-binding protein [Planctomycetota bacterium]